MGDFLKLKSLYSGNGQIIFWGRHNDQHQLSDKKLSCVEGNQNEQKILFPIDSKHKL